MAKSVSLGERIEGCLCGAAIGAGLGVARWVHADTYNIDDPQQIPHLPLKPSLALKEEPHRAMRFSPVPFIDLGVRAYLSKGGRVMPEDFAALLAGSRDVAFPAFALDNVHTIQEVLKEGMHPRLGGLGVAPCGIICAAMPAVGIYHFADPDRAYLDGVELASVAQPRLGADWAGLCAAAVAAAFEPQATRESVIAAVLKIAHQNNKDLFYELNELTSTAGGRGRNEKALLTWWLHHGCKCENLRERNWTAYNPIRFVLPLLRLGVPARRVFQMLLAAQPEGIPQWFTGGLMLPAVVAGAVLGALEGPATFAKDLLDFARPVARPWLGIAKVVRSRLEKERQAIQVIAKGRQGKPSRGSAARDLLHDKIYGNILAGAIGNAMGSPVEGQFYWEIDQKHPGGIKTVLQPERLEGEDDNQMAMLLTETYLERRGHSVMARHFGRTWGERMNRDHFFVLCMGNAYDLIRAGWDPRITGHWSVVTGSTVMCMEPAGIFNVGDPEFAFVDALAVSYMYQRGLDALVAANLAATVAEALRPGASVDSVCRAALETAPAGPLRTFDRRKFKTFRQYLQACLDVADKYDDVLAARQELSHKCLLYHPIDPLELWGLALAMFKIARGDVRQAAIGGTNIGRDSDTIAGRAAMLAGTLKGAGNVPKEWVAMFPRRALDRIRTNARRFADLIVGGKLEILKARQTAGRS